MELQVEPTSLYLPKVGFLARDEQGRVCACASGKTESVALERLVHQNYLRVCNIVMEQARFKCSNCGAYTMQVHHMKFRSHGRKDTIENLKTLCPRCHSLYHGEKP